MTSRDQPVGCVDAEECEPRPIRGSMGCGSAGAVVKKQEPEAERDRVSWSYFSKTARSGAPEGSWEEWKKKAIDMGHAPTYS